MTVHIGAVLAAQLAKRGLIPGDALKPARSAAARATAVAERVKLEAAFAAYLTQLGGDLPGYVREHRFDAYRKWRFDFAWPALKVAVEIEGGTWAGGRHTRGAGYEADAAKYNAAVLAGWRVLRFTGGMLKADPVGCIDTVRQLIGGNDG